jgi:hypothetical protein
MFAFVIFLLFSEFGVGNLVMVFSVFYTADLEAHIEIIIARPVEFNEFFLLNVIYFI